MADGFIEQKRKEYEKRKRLWMKNKSKSLPYPKFLKTLIVCLFVFTDTFLAYSQESKGIFNGYLYNNEYQIFMNFDFYKNNIKVRGGEIYGELSGYFGSKRDGAIWLITSSKIHKNGNKPKATLVVINDLGSEDFQADLIADTDSTFILKHTSGSQFKIVVNRKWVKIPKTLILKRE